MTITVKESFNKSKKWTLSIAAAVGAISDICTPLAPFSKYILIISLVLSAVLLISYFALKNFRDKILPILLFAVFSSFISGVLFGLKGSDNNNGFLANNIPALQGLQNSLGIISKDVSEIKETTKAIKEDTSAIKDNTSAIKESAKSIDNKMDTMIEKVGKQGGIVAEPSTAEEFYHNARIYEINGDYGNARRAYVKYFSFKEHKLDPHLRFQSFLKIQEGNAGAKDIYNEMFSESDDIVDIYAKILLENKESKREKLEEFAKNNADFGVVYYELARSYSKASLGEQGLSDKKAEKEYIEKFLKAYDDGKVTRYFIDKEELDKWLKYAKERETELSKINKEVFENAVSMSRHFGNNKQWQLNLSLTEKVKEIFYRIDGNGEFQSTGFFSDYIDRATGKPGAKTWFVLQDLEAPKEYIEFKYIDLNDRESQVFKINWVNKDAYGNDLDPKMESAIKWVKETTKDHWIQIDSNTLYFSFFGAPQDEQPVEKAMYGINKDEPDTLLEAPYITSSKNYIMKLSDDFEKISLQLFFKDGTKSEVKIFGGGSKAAKYAACINRANANADIEINESNNEFFVLIESYTPHPRYDRDACVEKIMYGIDKEEPDTELKEINGVYKIETKDAKEKVVLQRYYKDGSKSNIATFKVNDFCKLSDKINYVLGNKNGNFAWLRIYNEKIEFGPIFRNAKMCIDKVMYGINKDAPDTELEKGFSGNKMIKDVNSVSVQVFFKDGTKSDIEIFEK